CSPSHRMARSPLALAPLPYTTLFRSMSERSQSRHSAVTRRPTDRVRGRSSPRYTRDTPLQSAAPTVPPCHIAHWRPPEPRACSRSEEHTSELQSRENLVCRLLLEKKK